MIILMNISESFSYSIDNENTNYLFIELIPKIDLKYMLIKYEISKSDYDLYNGKNKNESNIISNYPYYYSIKSYQYQQVNIYLTTQNKLGNKPFEFIQIFELGNRSYINSYIKYINKTLQFVKDNKNNSLISSLSYTIDSIYTSYIIVKIMPKEKLNYLNIKMEVGGGYYEIEKGTAKNISNLFSGFSYYVFILSSIWEKLNIKLITNTNDTKKPFDALNIYEYSNKNSPLIYLKNTRQDKFNTEIKSNETISLLSYKSKDNNTNFIAIKIIPNYNISSIEFFVEIIEEKESSFSLIMFLIVILIIVISITVILFFIYIKKSCFNNSYFIENDYSSNKKEQDNKFELAFLNGDPISTLN